MENMFSNDSPLEVDLESLLGMTSAELEEESAPEVVLLNEDTSEVGEPHIKIPTKKLEDILKISAILASSGMGSLDSKCVCMDIQEGKIRFLLTDAFMINVVKEVELLNTDNQFTGTLVFSTGVLARVIKVCGSIFTLVERVEDNNKKSYALKIMGGELPIDNIGNANLAVYSKDFTNKTFKEYNKHEILNNLKRLFAYVNSALKDSRVLNFSGNVIQVSPHGSATRCELSETYPSFGMKVSVARLLHLLSQGDGRLTVKINEDGNVFQGDNYSMIVSNVDSNVCAYDSIIGRMFIGDGCTVDIPHLTRLTELSCGLDYSSGMMKFNYTKDGMVSCELITKRKNSVLELRGTPNSGVTPLENPVEVSSVNLKNVLSVFPQEPTALLRVSTDGISLESGKVRSIVLGRGVGK